MRATLLFAACALSACLAAAPSAGADVFGPISLASEGRLQGSALLEQADYAKHPTISADGRYVAFDGSFAGRMGVFRRDLLTGEVAVVAEGNATMPSISSEGRYISFTTTARLDRENDTNSAPDAYVRDMEVGDSEPCGEEWEQKHETCAFTLASAANGSSKGLHYEYPGNQSLEEPIYGSLASGRSALSADGQKVAFITTAMSNLAGPGTPKLQVAVRDLESKRTELVSTVYHDGQQTEEPVPTSAEGYGAVFPGSTITPEFGSAFYQGASISADGSTVAWMGQSISSQAPVLSGEDPASARSSYTEPLWRRVGEGPQSPIRRVTGGSDPASQACQESGETQLALPATLSDPCQGPFETTGGQGSSEPGLWDNGIEDDFVPQLSADGTTVAFLASARWIAGGEEFKTAEDSDDLYMVDMRDGLTRVQAARRLTELASGVSTDTGRVAPIVDLGVSPDGSQVAFTTRRTVFPLGSPAFVSAPAAAVGMVELYDIDLSDDTLTRVTQGYEGRPTEAPPGVNGVTASPSFAAGDELLAFSSTADNLVYGDGNDASDAFIVPRLSFAPVPAPQAISVPPANPAPALAWSLSVTATSQRDGSVTLFVEVPGAGALHAAASSAVRVTAAHTSKAAKARHATRRGRAAATKVLTRTVASRSSSPHEIGLIEVPLALAKSYKALAERPGGLYSTVNLTFAAAGHSAVHQSIPVTFVRTLPVKKRPTAKHASRHRR